MNKSALIILFILFLISCDQTRIIDIYSNEWVWQNSDTLFENNKFKYQIHNIDSTNFDNSVTLLSDNDNEIKKSKIDRIFQVDTLSKHDSSFLIRSYEGDMSDTINYKKILLKIINKEKVFSSIIVAINESGILKGRRIYSTLISNKFLIVKEIIIQGSDIHESGLIYIYSGATITRITRVFKIDLISNNFVELKNKKEDFRVKYITNKLTNKTKVKLMNNK